MKPHVNVVICTPGHSVMGSYNKALFETIHVLSREKISWAWANDYSSHVGDAREVTLNNGKSNSIADSTPFQNQLTYDKLIWIDSDISWTPEDFLKLYESDKDIISGAYLFSNGEVVAYPKLLGQAYNLNQIEEMKEPVKIEGCGFGFLAVKQGVFESLSRPWFQSTPIKYIDKNGTEIEFMMMGEDLSWCKRVQDKGYEIWFDPTIKVLHHKTMKLTWEGPRP